MKFVRDGGTAYLLKRVSGPRTSLRDFPARFCKSTEGVAAVEFALVLPVLLTMVLGIMEAGLLFQLKNSMTFHTRSIAREIALEQIEGSVAVSELNSRLDSYVALGYTVSIHEPDANNTSDNDVVVTVTLPQADAENYAITGWLVTSDLSTTATMRGVGQ